MEPMRNHVTSKHHRSEVLKERILILMILTRMK
jgi:hypothetical protein